MRILIIKIGALGDVVRTSFIAQALMDKYSRFEPEIFWVTDSKAKAFFMNNPYIYSIIDVRDREKLRKIKFDLVINLEEDEETSKFVSSLICKRVIGVFMNSSGKLDYTIEGKNWFDMSMISEFGKEKADSLKFENKKTHRELISEIIGVNPEKYEPSIQD